MTSVHAVERLWPPGYRAVRGAVSLGLLLLGILWLSTLIELYGAAARTVPSQGSAQLIVQPAAPSWRDVLVVDATLTDVALQRQVGLVSWVVGGVRQQAVLWLLTDGRPRRYVLPLGAHPGWRGDATSVSVSLPPQVGSQLALNEIRVVRRPAWAPDALLLGLLWPLLPELPPWPHLLLLTAALLGAALLLALPLGTLRRRMALGAVALGVASGAAVLAAQLGLLSAIVATYGPLDERGAMLRTPATLESTSVNAALLAGHDALPNGPVLALGYAPGGGTRERSHLVYLGRSLLAPRRIDAVPEDLSPGELAGRLRSGGYVGLLARDDTGRPPLPDWQRVTPPGQIPVVWRARGLPAFQPLVPGAGATVRLLGVLVLVGLAGWSLAGLVGWRGVERIIAGWAVGAVAVGIWMFALMLVGVRWSALSIGLPLALLGAGALLHAGQRGWMRAARWHVGRADVAAIVLILALTTLVGVQARLMPFTDQDTWTNWGLKGRAFYYDGALEPVMRAYHQLELYHMGYPPSQPLLQTLGYLAMSGISERLIKLIFPLWYAACLALVYLGCRQSGSSRRALGWMLLLATTPVMLDHATLGNADLALATLWLLAALGLGRWVEHGERRWLIAGTSALAAAAWIKIDGSYFGPALLAAAMLARLWSAWRQEQPWLPALGAGAAAALVVILSIGPWSLYVSSLELRSELPSVEPLARDGLANLWLSARLMLEQLLLSHSNSAWGLLGSGYAAFWLICGGALALQVRRLPRDPVLAFLVLSVLGGIMFYIAIYIVEPFVSHDRYLLHLAPIAALAAARSLYRPTAGLRAGMAS